MEEKTVDHSAIKVSQTSAMIVFITSLVLNRWELVAAMSVVFLVSAIAPKLSPFALLYRYILRPLGLIKEDIRNDIQEAHTFAQYIGIIFAGVSAYLIYAGYTYIGWGLVISMIVLAMVSLSGWCIGCFFYYLINKTGLGGFFKYSPTDNEILMGSHPKRTDLTMLKK